MTKHWPMTINIANMTGGAAALVLTAGCVTVPSTVVPVGKDTYQISMTGVGFATQANTNVKALQAANEYCEKLGKHLVSQHNGEAGVYGWSPRQSNLTFLCLDANDPEYVHPKTQAEGTGLAVSR